VFWHVGAAVPPVRPMTVAVLCTRRIGHLLMQALQIIFIPAESKSVRTYARTRSTTVNRRWRCSLPFGNVYNKSVPAERRRQCADQWRLTRFFSREASTLIPTITQPVALKHSLVIRANVEKT
jgi:hypothetical protein